MARGMTKARMSAACLLSGATLLFGARSYGRKEEYAADKHGVTLLSRVGQPKEVMINTLTWLMQREGAGGGGGFFATHPATGDRIEAFRGL